MAVDPYLIRLVTRLNAGLARIDPQRRERHRAFVLSQQQPDGGFCGRDDHSDLYYTSFAVRCLTILGGLTPDDCQRVGQYLKSHERSQLSIIDLVSWLFLTRIISSFRVEGLEFREETRKLTLDSQRSTLNSQRSTLPDWPGQIADVLESVRTEDGGYAKTRDGAAGSTYHSFLIALVYELLGKSVPNSNELVQFVYDRQRDDGGFVEITPMQRSGTNPTAAAVALLGMFDLVDDELREDVRDFLLDVTSPEGGFLANTRIPFGDGLSTFTGLLTAQDLGFGRMIDTHRMEQFVAKELEFPTGGFRGAGWDNQADVEYSFYGLGILGLLWSEAISMRGPSSAC